MSTQNQQQPQSSLSVKLATMVWQCKNPRFSGAFGNGSYYSREYTIGGVDFTRERSTSTLDETSTDMFETKKTRPLSMAEFNDWCNMLDVRLVETLRKIKL